MNKKLIVINMITLIAFLSVVSAGIYRTEAIKEEFGEETVEEETKAAELENEQSNAAEDRSMDGESEMLNSPLKKRNAENLATEKIGPDTGTEGSEDNHLAEEMVKEEAESKISTYDSWGKNDSEDLRRSYRTEEKNIISTNSNEDQTKQTSVKAENDNKAIDNAKGETNNETETPSQQGLPSDNETDADK
ncbi:hypothetical protein [Oceanobacillus massiliensis]|uniref:hypothetical protein n=1 Tax=Oceanobacillus massiliensis TaxID=1465765 RepID=UPI0030193AD9